MLNQKDHDQSMPYGSLLQRVMKLVLGKMHATTGNEIFVAKNSATLFLLHIISIVLVFTSNYLLVRITGSSVYGNYVYVFNFIALLSGFSVLGIDNLVVKQVAIYNGENKLSLLKGLIWFGILASLIGSLILAILGNFYFTATEQSASFIGINWLLFSFLILAIISVTTILQATLQGVKKIFYSQVVEKLVKPLLFIVVLIIVFYSTNSITLQQAVGINSLVLFVAMVVVAILVYYRSGIQLKGIATAFEVINWSKQSFSFLLLGILYTLNSKSDIFLLGMFRSSSEVGIYNVALKISDVIGLPLFILNFVLAPVIAKLFNEGDRYNLQKLLTRSARFCFVVSIPFFLLLIIFSKQVLSLFGTEIVAGSSALIILCFGQLINIMFGSTGLLLLMTNNQKYSIISMLASTATNILLNVFLTKSFGFAGTAIAVTTGLVVWNGLMYYFIRKKLDLHTTAIKF